LPIVPNEQFFEELFIDGTFGAVVLNWFFRVFDLFKDLLLSIKMVR
jgi:hypothetical protein